MFLNITWELFNNRSASVRIEIKGDFLDWCLEICWLTFLFLSHLILLLISSRLLFPVLVCSHHLFFCSYSVYFHLILYVLFLSQLIFSVLDSFIFPIMIYCYLSSSLLFSFFSSCQLMVLFFVLILLFFVFPHHVAFFLSSYLLHSLLLSAHLNTVKKCFGLT